MHAVLQAFNGFFRGHRRSLDPLHFSCGFVHQPDIIPHPLGGLFGNLKHLSRLVADLIDGAVHLLHRSAHTVYKFQTAAAILLGYLRRLGNHLVGIPKRPDTLIQLLYNTAKLLGCAVTLLDHICYLFGICKSEQHFVGCVCNPHADHAHHDGFQQKPCGSADKPGKAAVKFHLLHA